VVTPFHAGELAVQQRMGQAHIADRVGRMIRAEIPDVAATFLAEQPMLVLAAADAEDRLWASELIGPPGFVRAVDAETLFVDAHPDQGDPLHDAFAGPRRIGMIALQPQRRRRMRVNGTAMPEVRAERVPVPERGGIAETGLRITVDQVYSNCPKYISSRQVEVYRPDVAFAPPTFGVELDARQQATVASADAFFLATADTEGNVDASHRGGNPGFLQVLSSTRLRWPDYQGNSMFMTLGNIAVNPRCGILIPDWSTGGALQLSGTAELVWAPETFSVGAQCSIDFTISDVVERRGAGPLVWGPAELSPVNP
jgi:predicted pyridoxine 5'-phosphate oxidase superfamily flavin-nucleotide-binding protein